MTTRARPAWLELSALRREVKNDRVSDGAAALTFYLLLSIFPAAIFGLSLLPYLPIPSLKPAIMELVSDALPGAAADMLTSTVESVLSNKSRGLLSFGFLFATWSASRGLSALMQQLNVVYEVRERRSFIRTRGVALLLTVAFFFLVVGAFGLIVFGGVLQELIGDALGRSGALLTLFALLRWMIIVLGIQVALALVYWAGPHCERSFTLLSPGTTFATIGLIVVSFGFKLYVSRFASYDAVYGSLGAVIVLMMWLYFTGWVILLGSEINQLALRAKRRGSRADPGQQAAEAS